MEFAIYVFYSITYYQIVEWMNTMRLGDGGFISTIDTIVALEALVIYSYNSRIKDITNLNVIVDVPDSNVTKDFHITGNSKIARTQTLDIKNVWGHINLQAYGAGQAIGNSLFLYIRFIIYKYRVYKYIFLF